MRYSLLIGMMVFILFGCKNNSESDDKLLARLDTLNAELRDLRTQLNQKDSTNKDVNKIIDTSIKKSTQLEIKKVDPQLNPKKIKPVIPTTPKTKPVTKPIHSFQDEETGYYKASKKISYKKDAFKDGRRMVTFFHPDGSVAFTHKDEHLSWTNMLHIKHFHPNGAISEVEISMNPGASIYSYWEEITFDTDNTPLWKTSYRTPMYGLNDMPAPEYWDRKEQVWKKQEVSKETLETPQK